MITVETVQQRTRPPEFIVSEAPLDDFDQAHADYIEHGGQLDRESFQRIKKFSLSANMGGLLPQRHQASISQAASLEKHTGISLSEQEKQLYTLLRKQLLIGDLPEITGNRPQTMTDQRLMAEILRLTDPEKMAAFMSKYPHIFPE